MTRMLAIYASAHGCEFTIRGQVEPAVLIFGPEVFLPIIAMQADLDASFALGHDLGIEYEQDEQGLFGICAKVNSLTGDEISVLRASFFAHAAHKIFGISKSVQTIECEPVFEAYKDGLIQYIEKHGALKWPVATVLAH